MSVRSLAAMGAVVVAAFAFGAFSVWIYQKGAAYDAEVGPATLKGRAMSSKAHALEGLTSAVARGDLQRVYRLIDGIERSASAIDNYLDTDIYASYGSAFLTAVTELRGAIDDGDWVGAKDATLAIEQSCLDCHQLLLDR